MRNHFHLVVETPRPNLSAGMQWLLSTYTARFNRRHRFSGHLFSGRYKSLIVDGSGTGYLKTVCDYVHLNPVRAKLLAAEQRLKTYAWSSFPDFLQPARKRPAWLRVDRLLGEWSINEDTAAGRRHFEAVMEDRRTQEQSKESEEWKGLRRGWCWGEKAFREELLELIGEQRTEYHYGEELSESEAQKAQRLVAEMMAKAGWQESDLAATPKGTEIKVRIARRLRTETTMSWIWIARRLQMGHWRSAANAVRAAQS